MERRAQRGTEALPREVLFSQDMQIPGPCLTCWRCDIHLLLKLLRVKALAVTMSNGPWRIEWLPRGAAAV